MIYVCWTDVSGLDDESPPVVLSEYRRERLRRLKPKEARLRALGAEVLLQHALKKYCPELRLPPRILCADGGKPYLADTEMSFNLSHSGVYAACALSNGPVGLDIQTTVQARKTLAERVLTREEREYLSAAADRDAAFSELWCRKESFLKATGQGIAGGLQHVCVLPGAERMEFEGRSYTVRHSVFPCFHLAVCFPSEPEQTITIERIELP